MISSIIIYFAVFVALFFLPGFFLTVILGIKKFRFLLSFALSYSLLVFTLLPFEYYGGPIARWAGCVLLAWMSLAALAVAKTFIDRNFKISNVQRPTSNAQPQTKGFGFNVESWMLSVQSFSRRRSALIRHLSIPRLLVPLVLAGAICGYLTYAGPYLEIPADAWEHVRRFQWFKTGALEQGFFTPGLSFAGLLSHGLRWYFFHPWLCHVSGLPVIDSLYVLTFVNVLVFLLAIYYFGLFLFAGLRISALKKMTMAALAAIFAGATIGNMVFAYIRYYAFAPTILNYVLFLAAMAVIAAWLRSRLWFGHALWIAPILLMVTGLIHAQEALFIFFMTLALSLLGIVRIFWRKMTGRIDNHWSSKEWKTVILTAVLLIVFFAGLVAVRYFKPQAWISANMIMPHVAIPSAPVNFIFRKLLISPPENPWLRLMTYQFFVFYQVVGCWGLFVYLLFLLMIRRFVNLPYLIAGMIIVPFLTAFNPLTVDMMARLGQDPTIYRFHYLIPLPFVAAYLFAYSVIPMKMGIQKFFAWIPACAGMTICSSTHSSSNDNGLRLGHIMAKFLGSILVLAGLIGLIFPIDADGIYAPYSKIYTLRKIPAGNDYRFYDDLGKFITQYKNKVILSDGWTAGFLWSYSPQNTYGWLTWFSSLNPENNQPAPYTWEDLRNRGLIIVNCRNGFPSITGRIAKHWPEDILNVSRYYSVEAQNYFASQPEKFQKIWSQNRIAVYAVR